MRLIGGNISDTPVKEVGDGSAFNVGGAGGMPPDDNFDSVALLIQPHAGETVTEGLTDKGPDKRTPTVQTGSVVITDDYATSPLYGAYLNPSSARVTYSDDAGIAPASMGTYTIEAVYTPINTSTSTSHGMFGSGYPGSTTKRSFQGHFDVGSSYFYFADNVSNSSVGAGTAFTDNTISTIRPQSLVVQLNGDGVSVWWNGKLQINDQTIHASAPWANAWDRFNLFADRVLSPTTFSGNLISMRLTKGVARYSVGSDIIPNYVGFPES